MDTIKAQARGEEVSSSKPGEASGNPIRQRLIVCLDGTWNKQDSGTNIYHLANLIVDGEVTQDGWLQRVRYDSGVGTGVLDGVTGGAFGIGLSENVVESYDWLVEHYNDGDEIFVFGFSRGAFTARSLVALISKGGLLYRGAPVSPCELWAGYQILGRHLHTSSGSQPQENWWERIHGKPLKPFRELRDFHPAEWDGDKVSAEPANRTERLLKVWSRRVRVKCVGVYDTVGSMGLDALAIPWLRTMVAQFHDTRLNSIIQNGFHALAIDEHRANFSHIPWHRVVGESSNANIKQRWFAGAHSNVGGGYEDDALAMFPLKWMIEECSAPAVGLVFKSNACNPDPAGAVVPGECLPLLDGEPAKPDVYLAAKPPSVRDSFAEIAGGLWQHTIRSKRSYRRIAPPPELQNGMPMQSVNEALHESVLALRGKNTGTPYHPPNLYEHLKRLAQQSGETFTEEPPKHQHLEGKIALVGLVKWLLGLALAGWWIAQYLVLQVDVGRVLGRTWDDLTEPLVGGRIPWTPLHVLFVLGLPAFAFLVDWRESVLNHRDALDPDGLDSEKRKGWMDTYLALRLALLGLFAVGLLYTLFRWVRLDWPLSVNVCWLLILDVLLLWFMGSKAWTAGPMTDAGLGSIMALQGAASPAEVQTLLKKWANGDKPDLLAPIARTIWRDILGFIPAYSVTFFFGMWLLFSLCLATFSEPYLMHGLLAWHQCSVLTALGVTFVCAVADWIEDNIHLRYLDAFPDAPSGGLVGLARAVTFLKYGCVIIGLVSTFAAAIWLIVRIACELYQLHSGLVALLVAVASGFIISGVTLDFLSGPKQAKRKSGT